MRLLTVNRVGHALDMLYSVFAAAAKSFSSGARKRDTVHAH